MDTAQFWYFPLAQAFFLVLVGMLFSVFVVLPLGLMQYAYEQFGVSPIKVVPLLLASLIGTYINIPIAVISQRSVMANQVIWRNGQR